MEMYDQRFSEQAVGYPEADCGDLSTNRARLLLGILRQAGQFVGSGGGPDLISRLDFILSHARQGNLPASTYETIWELRGIFRERVIFEDVAGSVTK